MPPTLNNERKPLLRVRHSALAPADADHPEKFARQCPSCAAGSLRGRRLQPRYLLASIDLCIACGRWVEYLDIEDLRLKDWAGT
jgi:hypothetical protein